MNNAFRTVTHDVDFCVVGGGLAGMCAAIAAARHGLKTVIMQDRPVFGGNASGEIRMWVCGAHGKDNRETGIIEEIFLENLYRNPYRTWPIWDTVLFETVKAEKNITVLLNCSCNDIKLQDNTIQTIIGWQTTTQQWHAVSAKFFADCSGDSVLAPLSGAEYRVGREASDEFGESIAPPQADKKTMGMSCLIQARKMGEKRPFIAPSWANHYTKEQLLPYRLPNMDDVRENFWYMELGGEYDSIADTELLRDELLKVALGIWDYIKNSGDYDAGHWELDFLGFLPGKRESRRYVGDYIVTQNDVENEGRFEDIVAYGGWTMDDHHPGGISATEAPTIFHPAPSPFGIPYRALYSKNINNLFFAGRNISVTHSAVSSTRVMATCAVLGQAVGTAAAIAQKYSLSPRGVYQQKLHELQQTLLHEDCYLPFVKREPAKLTVNATVYAEGVPHVERLLNGCEREFEKNGVEIPVGTAVALQLCKAETLHGVRLVLDSDLNRLTVGGSEYMPDKTTVCNIPLTMTPVKLPDGFAREITVQYCDTNDEWHTVQTVLDNRKRLLLFPVECCAKAVRFTVDRLWFGKTAKVLSFSVY